MHALLCVIALLGQVEQTNEKDNKEFVAITTVEPHPQKHFLGAPTTDSGFVLGIECEIGKDVKKGELLINLDPAPKPLEYIKIQVDEAKCSLKVLEAQLKARENERTRATNLISKGGASVQAQEAAETNYNLLVEEIELAKVRVRLAEVNYEKAQYNYGYYQNIRSQIDGKVVAVHCKLGQIARTANSDLVYVEVVDDSLVRVKVKVTLDLARKLKVKESQVSISLGSTPLSISLGRTSKVFKGEVVGISPVVRYDRVTVLVDIPNNDHELVVGEEVRVTIPRD